MFSHTCIFRGWWTLTWNTRSSIFLWRTRSCVWHGGWHTHLHWERDGLSDFWLDLLLRLCIMSFLHVTIHHPFVVDDTYLRFCMILYSYLCMCVYREKVCTYLIFYIHLQTNFDWWELETCICIQIIINTCDMRHSSHVLNAMLYMCDMMFDIHSYLETTHSLTLSCVWEDSFSQVTMHYLLRFRW